MTDPSAPFVDSNQPEAQSGWSWLRNNVRPYSQYMRQLLLVIFVIVLLNVIVPITNRAMIDSGVLAKDTAFISLVIVLQIVIYSGILFLSFIRGVITSNISTRFHSKLLWHFFDRVLKLPPSYFANDTSGDILERIRDFERAQQFASRDLLDFIAAIIMAMGTFIKYCFGSIGGLFLTFSSQPQFYI